MATLEFTFILSQLEIAGIGRNIFSEDAIALIIRSSEGTLRKARNLCLSCLLEGVRRQKKLVDLENVNSVLRMPHWRDEMDFKLGQ